MKNIMRNKEVKLFAVIFAVFIASMMLFATTTHAATITTKNMPSTSVFVRSSKTLTKPSVSGFKWKAVNNTYYTLTTAGKLTGKRKRRHKCNMEDWKRENCVQKYNRRFYI